MIRINLIAVHVPRAHLAVEKQLGMLALLFAASIIVSFMWFFNVYSKKADVEQQLAWENTELKRLEAVQKRIDDFEKKKKRREEILKTIRKLQARRVGPFPFLDSLNVLMPPDIWLTKITEINLNITISGITFSSPAVADMMRKMEKSEHFSNVELTEIQQVIVLKEEVKKFTLTCNWDVEKEEEAEEEKKEEEKGKKKKA